ncbi:suppressor of tumorigenicity 14 protein homolog [Danaus plexippus]|uniref:suppressor of tumorigenicity 14 protein homolog n=1 Tax=Danaus plexippus TaxID=13037 RepID=UPI002AB2AEE5|nr:suppressor of tumorigenicity 14 protein homolog [Danaus plexippus]
MKAILILVLLIKLVCTDKVNRSCECGIAGKNRRIVGGTTVQPHQYPWLVALMLGSKLHCGGAIITDQHVLSAGHCITFGVNFKDLTVYIGMHDRLGSTHTVSRLKNGVKHPSFTSNAVRDINDIAILTLDKKLQFSDKVRPICLPSEGMDFKNVPLTVAGWGKTRQGALTSSRYLLETKVKIVPSNTCSKSSIYKDNLVTDSMMCAYSLGKDACQGDSGGPIFATHARTHNKKWYQVECGTPSDKIISMRIVGGRRAEPHSFPWTVAIVKNDRMHCGGAIITDRHVLSAGHCFKWDDRKQMKVYIGLDDLEDMNNVEVRNISNVVIHEQFTSTAVRDENDIAIATLNKPVTFSDTIVPICLPSPGQKFDGRSGTIVGWGRLGTDKTSSKVLMKASLRILSDEECFKSKLASHIKPMMMCAFTKGKDGCQGDSGGPLLTFESDGRYVQAGIVSWGIGCANPNYPGVYTKVSNYNDWIEKNTANGKTCD